MMKGSSVSMPWVSLISGSELHCSRQKPIAFSEAEACSRTTSGVGFFVCDVAPANALSHDGEAQGLLLRQT